MDGKLTTVRLFGGDAPEIAHSRFEASMPDTIAGDLARKRLERTVLNREITINPVNYQMPSAQGQEGRLIGEVSIGGRDLSAELEAAYPSYNLNYAQRARVAGTRADIEEQHQPYPFTERIFDDPFARIPRGMRNMTTRSLESINTAIQQQGEYSLAEKIIGRGWETVSHIQLPGPLNWPINKLFPQRDAMEYYRMRQLGAGFANWSTPFSSFIQPWAQQTLGQAFPGYIPGEVLRQQNTMENLDMLQYAKMSRLSGRARLAGDPALAGYFNQQSLRTMTGAIVTGNRRFVRRGLPRRQRSFYTPFARETSPERRERILEMVPPMFGTVLRQAWGQDVATERGMVRGAANEIASMAPNDWAGWHPDVPMHLMKVRVAKNEGWDFHDLGVANRESYLAEDLFDNYMPSLEGTPSFDSPIRGQAHRYGHQLKLDGMSVRVTDGYGPSFTRINIGRNRSLRNRFHDLWDSNEMSSRRF
jgi:hypothetical protein